jgi:hypothetical protein
VLCIHTRQYWSSSESVISGTYRLTLQYEDPHDIGPEGPAHDREVSDCRFAGSGSNPRSICTIRIRCAGGGDIPAPDREGLPACAKTEPFAISHEPHRPPFADPIAALSGRAIPLLLSHQKSPEL